MPRLSRAQRRCPRPLEEASGEEIRARQPSANRQSQYQLEREERATWGTKVKEVKEEPLSMASDTTGVRAAHKQRGVDWAQGNHDQWAQEISGE